VDFGHEKKQLFFAIELLLAFLGFVGLLFIFLMNSVDNLPHTFSLVLSHVPIVLVGILSGMEVPLLVSFLKGNRFAHVLGIDYFGSLLGTLLYGLYFYPEFGLVISSLIVASLNVIVAIIFITQYRFFRKSTLYAIIIVLLATLAAVFVYRHNIETFVENTYLSQKIKQEYTDYGVPIDSILIRKHFRTQYQEVTQYQVNFENPQYSPSDECLNLDTNVQMCDQWVEAYHRGLVDFPMSFFDATKNLSVLILGGGDFIPIEYLRHFDSRVKDIDLIDIDPRFQDYAKTDEYILSKNNRAFEYNKLHVTVDDAFQYLRHNTKTYDLILVDLPGVQQDKLLPLYSKEFYSMLRTAVKNDGLIVSWKYPEDIYPTHAAAFERVLYTSGFRHKFEYYALNEVDGYVQQTENFIALSPQKRTLPHFDNEYMEKFAKYFKKYKWGLVGENKNIKINSIFKPNYDLIISKPEISV